MIAKCSLKWKRLKQFQKKNFNRKSTIVNEREAGSNHNVVAVVKPPEVDENGERDKLVQFEKTPEESSYAQNYLANVSAIS